MRTLFDEQLNLLHTSMVSMGTLCEDAIAMAAKALEEKDTVLAEKVPALAGQIDRKEREIESLCMRLLLTQQPVASDLRVISAALKMVTDLERIGNQSADIAEIVQTRASLMSMRSDSVHDMALAVIKMVNDSIDAFLHANAEEAGAVIQYDDVVDRRFDTVKSELVDRLKSDASCREDVVDILMIAKYLERIGDHAVNVAKWALFSLTGEWEE